MSKDPQAADMFWDYVFVGRLPASLAIIADGEVGLATSGFRVDGGKAQKLVFSDDPQDRAMAALHAIHDAGEAVERHYEDVSRLVP